MIVPGDPGDGFAAGRLPVVGLVLAEIRYAEKARHRPAAQKSVEFRRLRDSLYTGGPAPRNAGKKDRQRRRFHREPRAARATTTS